ncbi:protein kinase [candidate division KSB1 bacterium]|nr:protein kinase [candidate division KSB1 bacterium]
MRDKLLGMELGGGRFQIIGDQPLGKGGFATVYLGLQKPLNRKVAIKVLSAEASQDEELVKRFIREARVVAMFDHPNIIKVIDSGSEEDIHYFVMNYLPNTLRYVLLLSENQHGLPLESWLKIAIDIASALIYIHHHNTVKEFVHRDIKPANIMFDESENAILTDFGLVKGDQFSQLTLKDTVMGTPKYMSPEQVKGERLDHRSDLYSLGIVLYEMLAGRPPFVGEPLTICHKQVAEPPPRPEHFREHAPARVIQIILKLLEKDPEKRYPSAKSLLQDLEEWENITRSHQFSHKNVPVIPEEYTPPASKTTGTGRQSTTGSYDDSKRTVIRSNSTKAEYLNNGLSTKKIINWRHPLMITALLALIIGLAIVQVVFTPFQAAKSRWGYLRLISTPAGASIQIADDLQSVKTPTLLQVPAEDSLAITFSLANFTPIVRKLYVTRGDTQLVMLQFISATVPISGDTGRTTFENQMDTDHPRPRPDPKLSQIRIESNPPNAAIYRNGRTLNRKTPFTLTDLKPGKITLQLRLDGHATWTKEVILESGQNLVVSADLAPHPLSPAAQAEQFGMVSIFSSPYGQIWIEGDSESRGTTPTEIRLPLRSTPYRITVKRFGYETVEGYQEVELKAGVPVHLTFTLRESGKK